MVVTKTFLTDKELAALGDGYAKVKEDVIVYADGVREKRFTAQTAREKAITRSNIFIYNK